MDGRWRKSVRTDTGRVLANAPGVVVADSEFLTGQSPGANDGEFIGFVAVNRFTIIVA